MQELCLPVIAQGWNGANIVVISVEPTVLLSVGNDGARGTVDDVVLVDDRVFFIKQETVWQKLESAVLLNLFDVVTWGILGFCIAVLLWQSIRKKSRA
jgi:hypothetical protein